MTKVKIITDSNAGFSNEEAKELGVYVIPMPFTIDCEEYFEGINITTEEFFNKLKSGADVLTSQPSQLFLEETWEEFLKEYDYIIHIPMSSGLSASCQSAINLAKNYNGRVIVIDNTRISVTQKASVIEACNLVKIGKDVNFIKEYLTSTREKNSIYIIVNELKYLKKGGRISPAVAAIGSLLKVKPILTSKGQKFEKFALGLSMSISKQKIINKIISDLNNNYKEEYESGKISLGVAYTGDNKDCLKFRDEILAKIPNIECKFVDHLSLSVSCHIGEGAIAAAIMINTYL